MTKKKWVIIFFFQIFIIRFSEIWTNFSVFDKPVNISIPRSQKKPWRWDHDLTPFTAQNQIPGTAIVIHVKYFVFNWLIFGSPATFTKWWMEYLHAEIYELLSFNESANVVIDFSDL